MSWFYAKHGKQEGPVEETELRSKLASGELSADDLVWREGMAEWQPAGKIPELAPQPGGGAQTSSTLGAGPGVSSGPPPASAAPPAGSAPIPSAGAPGGVAMQGQPSGSVPGLITPPPTSGLAIASMVCGIIGVCLCFFHALGGIPAVVCGHLALKGINETPHAVEGRGMAITGLVTGYLSIVMTCFWILLTILRAMQ